MGRPCLARRRERPEKSVERGKEAEEERPRMRRYREDDVGKTQEEIRRGLQRAGV